MPFMVAWTLTGRESMLGILARWVRRRRREVAAFLAVALRLLLVLGGLGALTMSAWSLAHWAGWAMGGVSLLLLEWIVKRQ